MEFEKLINQITRLSRKYISENYQQDKPIEKHLVDAINLEFKIAFALLAKHYTITLLIASKYNLNMQSVHDVYQDCLNQLNEQFERVMDVSDKCLVHKDFSAIINDIKIMKNEHPEVADEFDEMISEASKLEKDVKDL